MTVAISGLSRHFGSGSAALDGLDVQIEDGEFVALLGPSGSGKTTLLRILAGLDFPDSGSIHRNGENLLALDARARGVGMVFQHYALFRHMTVADNIAFGLRIRNRRQRPERAEIEQRVRTLLERVELGGFGDRYPGQLSGGQQQRVALARALAIEPGLLLLDEPFGALDAKVRLSLRRWLRQLHGELGLTTIFVSHDQEEAFALADRIVVMNQGRIEQAGTPAEIYRAPASPFVFEFIGSCNRLDARVADGALQVGGLSLPLSEHQDLAALPHTAGLIAYVRPEDVWVANADQRSGGKWSARITHMVMQGGAVRLDLQVGGLVEQLEAEVGAQQAQQLELRPGKQVLLRPLRLTLYPEQPGITSGPRILEFGDGGAGVA